MRFGCVFKIKVSSIPLNFIPLLLKAFSPVSHMFKVCESKQFLLSKHDVHDMFLLPISSTPLNLTPTGRSKGSTKLDLKNYWRDKFGITDKKSSIPLTRVFARLSEIKEVTDEFKKLFVWYTMAVFFAPTSNYVVDFELLNAIEDVSQINKQDWCQYVFESLVSATKPPKKGTYPKFLCGCIMFLMLTYFHRFDFRGERLDHTLPLIQHWDDDKFDRRVKLELLAKGLGDAPLSSLSFPIYLNSERLSIVEKSPVKQLLHSNDENRADVHQPSSDSNPQGRSDKRTLIIDLPENAYNDEDIARMSIDVIFFLILYFHVLF